jgi:hypothetical protein
MKKSIIISIVIILVLFSLYKLYSLYFNKDKSESFYHSNLTSLLDSDCNNPEYIIPNSGKDWFFDGTILGKGKKGIVYGGVDKNGMKVAIKVIDFVQKNKLKEEALNTLFAFSTLQIAPKIYDAIWCNYKGYIITEYIPTSLVDYLKNNFSKGSPQQSNEINKFRKIAEKYIIKMMNENIMHSDLHIDNFMIRMNQFDDPELIIIDWDAAIKNKFTPTDIKEKIDDLNLTFNLLYKNLIEEKSIFNAYKVPEAPSKKRRPPTTDYKPSVSFTQTTDKNLFSAPQMKGKITYDEDEENESQNKINQKLSFFQSNSDEYELLNDEYGSPNKLIAEKELQSAKNLFKGETELNKRLFE